jgi:hypothetical protein
MINCDLKGNANKSVCKKEVGEGHFIIVLPKTDNSQRRIKVKNFEKYFNNINGHFGGNTTIPTTMGCWLDKDRNKMQCEGNFSIEVFRDFDQPEFKNYDSKKRKEQLEKDNRFLKKTAKEIANEFGQAEVPVVFDNIRDVSMNKGTWKKKIDNKKVGKKVKGNLYKKYLET